MAVDQEHTIWALCGVTLFGNSRLETLVHEADILWGYLNRQATTFIKGISVSQPLLLVVTEQLGSRVLEMHQGTALRWRAAGEGVLQRKVVAAPFGDDQQVAAST
ncbi:hypothetical protein AnigIFM56816_004872 [Aspergillus niger]|nr:hypothetical protein AnigIFM56816_004872 [Aspergillus niger]